MIKKCILLASGLLVFSSSNVYSEEVISISKQCLENPMIGHYYRQQKYATQSHQEDMILTNLANRYSESLLDVLKIKRIKEEKREADEKWIQQNCAPYVENENNKIRESQQPMLSNIELENLHQCRKEQNEEQLEKFNCEVNKIIRKSPITVKGQTKKFKKAMSEFSEETGIELFRSPRHKWSSKKRLKLIRKFPAAALMPKILAGLAMGVTSRFMATEKDTDLRQWLLEQPMSSIAPEDLLKKSLEFQEGDVYKAILSIENVLSEFWLNPDRERFTQTSALKSITYTCDPKQEDVFGSWYHLFGTMLLGCVKGPILTTLVGRTESLGGRILDIKQAKEKGINLAYHLIIGSDPQEEKINARGGKIGHRICKGIPKRK